MLTDLQLCQSCIDSYHKVATIVVGDIHIIVEDYVSYLLVTFRGTVITNVQDWLRDFTAWPATAKPYPKLGYCHAGFLNGGIEAFGKLSAMVTKPLLITGHSLGGALAVITAGLFTSNNLPPVKLTTFGCPRIGFTDLQQLASIWPGNHYINGNDPVVNLPEWPYLMYRKGTVIGHDMLDCLSCHHIRSYYASLEVNYAAINLSS